MKQKDIAALALIALITAIFAFVLSGLIFKTPLSRSSTVPTADGISTTFPDIQNDPSYNTIFNGNALDPAQPVQVGSTQNSQPFNGTGAPQ